MGMVNKVVPLERLEDETVEWCETILKRSPMAIRMIKRAMNAELDGQRGMMEFAGDATLMYYLMAEAQEGKNAFLEKRDPDFGQFPKFRADASSRLLPLPAALQAAAITSRAVMLDKTTYFVKIWDDDNPEVYGVGECALFKGLGADDLPDYEQRLAAACRDITSWHRGLPLPVDPLYSSIVFGLETARRPRQRRPTGHIPVAVEQRRQCNSHQRPCVDGQCR